MLEQEEHFPFNDLMEIHVLNPERLPPDGEGRLMDWLRFLKAETEEEFKMIAEKNPMIYSPLLRKFLNAYLFYLYNRSRNSRSTVYNPFIRESAASARPGCVVIFMASKNFLPMCAKQPTWTTPTKSFPPPIHFTRPPAEPCFLSAGGPVPRPSVVRVRETPATRYRPIPVPAVSAGTTHFR
jgi:hypothetical protein